MLDGDSILLKSLKCLAAEAHLGVHHILVNIDCNKSLLACNTGNRVIRLLTGAFHNQGSCCFRIVGIADINRNARFAHRENSILMKNRRTHVGELTKLSISDNLNWLRIINNARVCNQTAGYIRPVLIHRSARCLCNNGTGNIRTAS